MFETVQKLAIAVLVGMAVVGAVQDWSNDVPSVTAGYYEQTQTGGEIEADYTAMGEYEVAHAEYPAQDVLVKQYEVWYPAALAADDGREWPIVVMANGTGVPASRYAPVFQHLASWGFVVIGNEMQNSWSGDASAGALDLLIALNEDPDSLFYLLPQAGHRQRRLGGPLAGGHRSHQRGDQPAERRPLQGALSGQHPVQPLCGHPRLGL